MTQPNTEPKPATDEDIEAFKRWTASGRIQMMMGDNLPSLFARIEQEREMRRELVRVLKPAIDHCDCADYNNKALFPCTDDRPCAGCYMTRTADALLSRAAKMEADYGK